MTTTISPSKNAQDSPLLTNFLNNFSHQLQLNPPKVEITRLAPPAPLKLHPQPWCGNHENNEADSAKKNAYNYGLGKEGVEKTPMCRVAELARYNKRFDLSKNACSFQLQITQFTLLDPSKLSFCKLAYYQHCLKTQRFFLSKNSCSFQLQIKQSSSWLSDTSNHFQMTNKTFFFVKLIAFVTIVEKLALFYKVSNAEYLSLT
uniref:Uncharacterized protein n=1 Tax=Ditylenchus dipsaci TaxID=166011 RepID=A0A915CWK9_9BILA